MLDPIEAENVIQPNNLLFDQWNFCLFWEQHHHFNDQNNWGFAIIFKIKVFQILKTTTINKRNEVGLTVTVEYKSLDGVDELVGILEWLRRCPSGETFHFRLTRASLTVPWETGEIGKRVCSSSEWEVAVEAQEFGGSEEEEGLWWACRNSRDGKRSYGCSAQHLSHSVFFVRKEGSVWNSLVGRLRPLAFLEVLSARGDVEVWVAE